MKTVLETLQSGTEFLAKKKVENPRLNMQLLMAHVLGCSKLDLYLQFDRPLGESLLQPLREMLRRRGQREPLQHVLGSVEFLGQEFLCDARALIPRPETEQLADFLAKNPPEFQAGDWVGDVGAGGGVLGLSLAKAWRDRGLRFLLVDASADALALARENARRLGLEDSATFAEGDLLAGREERFRLLAANLPYVPTAELANVSEEVKRDPVSALDGGEDGLRVIERFLPQAHAALLTDGLVALEIGAGQAGRVVEGLAAHGFQSISVRKDLSGIERFVLARKL